MSASATSLLPLVLALPLSGFVVLTLLGGRLGGRWCGRLATALVGLAFVLALAIARDFVTRPDLIAARARAADASGALEGEGHDAADGSGAGGAHVAAPAVERTLWRWMAIRQPLSELGPETRISVTVAAADIRANELIAPELIDVIAIDPAANPGIERELPFVWDAAALADAQLQSLNGIPAGALITTRLAPPFRTMMRPGAAYKPVAAPGYAVDVALRLDALSLVMLLIVTGVGFLIHVFSTGYMAHDPERRRYFAYLNLFIFSMLTLVLGANFLVLFVGWEMVGACSYLLIGFWHADPVNAAAGRKAFVVNRVGDLAFLVALMLVWTTYGSLSFAEVLPQAARATGWVALAIPALLLAGATGKSAQLPLHVWLPDAMAGPTPVSALIHAATMVTAGVYMIARVHPLFEQAPAVLAAVALVGAGTALMAALIALVQVDIKRVLAYSTISQLGYMFLAVGAGAYAAGIFHLMTHAFFKALLFLGAGSLMHAMEHGFAHAAAGAGAAGDAPEAPDADGDDDGRGVPAVQDMRLMGGLLRRAPVTGWTFVIGGLALAGLFPLSGFFSKDEILHAAAGRAAAGGAEASLWLALTVVAYVTAFLTAVYTGRQLLMVLYGPPRSAGAAHAAESPPSMTGALVALAALSVIGGLPALHALGAPLPATLATVLPAHHGEGPSAVVVAALATAATLGGLGLAWATYGARAIDPTRVAARLSATHRAARAGFGIDALYASLVVGPLTRLAGWLWRRVDDGVIDATVNAAGRGAVGLGQASRRWQTGQVRRYGLSILLGAAALAAYLSLQ